MGKSLSMEHGLFSLFSLHWAGEQRVEKSQSALWLNTFAEPLVSGSVSLWNKQPFFTWLKWGEGWQWNGSKSKDKNIHKKHLYSRKNCSLAHDQQMSTFTDWLYIHWLVIPPWISVPKWTGKSQKFIKLQNTCKETHLARALLERTAIFHQGLAFYKVWWDKTIHTSILLK